MPPDPKSWVIVSKDDSGDGGFLLCVLRVPKPTHVMSLKLSRRQYAEMFGPTVGDRVRLADTELFVQVERDLVAEGGGYGNEIKFGGGKVIRDGMGQSPTALDKDCLDLVITNALILDPLLGIIKADIGIKHGVIVGIGHAGNPGIQSGLGSVYPDPKTKKKNPMIVGAATEVIAGEGCIVSPNWPPASRGRRHAKPPRCPTAAPQPR